MLNNNRRPFTTNVDPRPDAITPTRRPAYMIDARTRKISRNNTSGILLDENRRRTGVLIHNATNTILRILLSDDQDANEDFYSYAIGQMSQDRTLHDVRPETLYRGRITFHLDNPTTGFVMVTEFIVKEA